MGHDSGAQSQPRPTGVGTTTVSAQREQLQILWSILTQGLAQAKYTFRVSLTIATLGAGVLLTAVMLAIFQATTTGGRYAAVLSGGSGALIIGLATMFFRESARARHDMPAQGVSLTIGFQAAERLARAHERIEFAHATIGSIQDTAKRDAAHDRLAHDLIVSLSHLDAETPRQGKVTVAKSKK